MSYQYKTFHIKKRIKVFMFLMNEFNITLAEAQRWIDKKRVYVNGKLLVKKSQKISGEVKVLVFVPNTKGIKPIFETKDFMVFDKPAGVLVHPRNRNCEYTMTHEIKYQYGKDANIVHRIDKETSGILVASKTKKVEADIKNLFENRLVKKGYLAFVKGKIENDIFIDENISKNCDFSDVKLKVSISSDGKSSQTYIKPIKYYKDRDITLIEAYPKTGRQHQIRVHMFHVKHPIVGDPIYGVSSKIAADYLDGLLSESDRIKFTGANRLMLHSNFIEFEYKNRYKIFSKSDFIHLLK